MVPTAVMMPVNMVGASKGLEELPKFFYRKSSILRDAAHGEGIDGIIAGNCYEPAPIRQNDVLSSLANNVKASFFQSATGFQMINSWKFWHL